MHASVVFQRSEGGRNEIQQKTHGLTQSQRLVLIMMDGVTPVLEVQKKLTVLSPERFERAFNKLKSKQLIAEVLFTTADLRPEIIDPADADRFLHQDALDPVTIVAFNADSDYELERYSETNQVSVSAGLDDAVVIPLPFPSAAPASTATGKALASESVDFFIPLEKKSRSAERFTLGESPGMRGGRIPVPVKSVARFLEFARGPLLMMIGIALLVVSIGLKLTR